MYLRKLWGWDFLCCFEQSKIICFMRNVLCSLTMWLCSQVTCVGHIIGAVVADTPEHAQRASHGVKVTYEDLPAIITIEVTGGGLAGEGNASCSWRHLH